ncbi:protein ABSCISIC ACID-INSENSITIVE 5-like isoform X1 [Chenopodium quinoa]|uniref:protein ABSCISIC ACID-INSENSITIVE 5-like isoform X1 n=1 Tax=Chenopodium quinoa TaxID=63459 RepID=UPI000B78781C|nr:protein ABSCISIC ACID-INSENSITIVE 5-like isoform X1 [Chenopodium quinoa]
MVAAELEIMAQAEVNSPAMTATIDPHHNPKNNHTDHNHNHGNGGTNNNNNNNYAFPALGRQSSIYSLTLDEFQHTLSENGKNFGSMNMDEFLNSIWTAEENQSHHGHHHEHPNNVQLPSVSVAASSSSKGAIAKQASLPRQGSLTLPAPLCRKTVDEVWTEIQRIQQPEDDEQQQNNQQQQQVVNSNDPQRQATFGEMTLEDFLIKAGVVREQCGPTAPTPLAVAPAPPPAQHPPHHQFGFSAPQMGPTFVTRPMMGMAPGGAYQPMPPSAGESSGYTGNGKRSNGYPAPVVGPSVACYGGRMNNGGGPGGAFTPGAPVSPVSPEGMCGPGQVDNPGGQYGMDMAALRGRKRIIDGPVEKVVERRQRRMIKNRESAARSRARKQAYTVELEAELNQLREENAQLKQALYHEEQNLQAVLSRAQRTQDKLRTMRSRSCTL